MLGVGLVVVVVRYVFHTLVPSGRPWQHRATSAEAALAPATAVSLGPPRNVNLSGPGWTGLELAPQATGPGWRRFGSDSLGRSSPF